MRKQQTHHKRQINLSKTKYSSGHVLLRRVVVVSAQLNGSGSHFIQRQITFVPYSILPYQRNIETQELTINHQPDHHHNLWWTTNRRNTPSQGHLVVSVWIRIRFAALVAVGQKMNRALSVPALGNSLWNGILFKRIPSVSLNPSWFLKHKGFRRIIIQKTEHHVLQATVKNSRIQEEVNTIRHFQMP